MTATDPARREGNPGNVVLTGFMGTGKTTVGRLLAERLGFDFVDTDAVLEGRHGPIADIFTNHGEGAFRSMERGLAEELADQIGLVISTGGRMLLDPANVRALSRKGRVFCLVATPEEILQRVGADSSPSARPLLAVPDPEQRILDLLAERSPHYDRFAQITTDGRPPEAVAADLATLVQSDPSRIAVGPTTGGYDVIVGAAVLPLVRGLAAINGPLVIVTTADVAETYLASCPAPDLVVTLPADGSTTPDPLQVVLDAMLQAAIDRSATIMSLGDSDVREVAAAAAATYAGGIDLVHCPTDLLAWVNTAVGLDVQQRRGPSSRPKQPKAVVADVATIQALAPRVFAAGLALVLKGALIAGSPLLAELADGDWRPREARGAPVALRSLESLLTQAVQLKVAITQREAAADGDQEPDRDAP